GGLALAVILCLLFPALHNTASRMTAFIQTVLGILAGGGSIYLIGKFGEVIFKKESMGGGDVKLMAMIGALLGWKLVLLIFFLAPFFGAVVGIIAKIRKGAEVIPYGPYLSLATFLALLWGKDILRYLFCF
ncbi:MAG: A24 family peptidase, partial [Candidatus Omnitrophica bacterium]|nr:A24 family peptidase [Candidatus Omnitrophota bacterium]